MSTEQFKKKFKVGDTLIGFDERARITITAIGKNRFLYEDAVGREGAATMSACHNWIKAL